MKFHQLVYPALAAIAVLAEDPGFPAANPSISYWQIPPHKDVADHQSANLPTEVDIVIIGSGITGTSIAWHLLSKEQGMGKLKVVMLEARQACSGATGRNGGHIRPSSYREYADAKKFVSQAEAAKITKLRAAHVDALISAANELPRAGREAAEARPVDSIDAFFNQTEWANAVKQLQNLKKEVPDIGSEWTQFDGDEARRISLLPQAKGILTGTPRIAGAIWPYRFVTHALKFLLDKYAGFHLDTRTPAQNVTAITDSSSRFNFNVSTPRGNIFARHVVYAANAWNPHFVPGMEGAIRGYRLMMSAQLGGSGLPKAGAWPSYTGNGSLPGGRAWSLFRGGLDYAVQMPRHGEYMFGGGISSGRDDDGAGPLDDGVVPDHVGASYLNGALPNYFGYENWGSERRDFPESSDKDVWRGRTKRVWVGIEGVSVDGRPLVGRLPEDLTLRKPKEDIVGAEWIATAYDGEGMCFAWLCGRALGAMIADQERSNKTYRHPDWFPESFLVTDDRIRTWNRTEGPPTRPRFSRMASRYQF